MPRKINVIPGDRYGQLTIIKEVERQKQHRRFLCKCDCGNETVVLLNQLRRGLTRSCGCLKEKVLTTQKGLSRSQIYHVYRDMIARCAKKRTCKAWDRYGKKGIRVCKEWKGKKGFANFYNWSITHGYIEEKINGRNRVTIDRIDSTKGYLPDNCRWVDYETQNCNLRMRENNKSGYRGVCFVERHKKYLATLSIKGKSIYLGLYRTKKEAVEARNAYIDEHNLPNQKNVYKGE